MSLDRREFLKVVGVAGGVAMGVPRVAAGGTASETDPAERMGVLVDLTHCIGCRKCEYACQEAAGFNPPALNTFDDTSVMAEHRRPSPRSHTVVNRFEGVADNGQPVFVKCNCLHCNEPACVSACLVSAFSQRADGAVLYDVSRCMGCRYCMVACPFQIPTYEYDNALTPQVRKCNLCAHLVPSQQAAPACVTICPEEAMTYGRRSELLSLARERIRQNPGKYVDHIYGEHEAGGTSWLYLSSVSFEQLGFLNLPDKAPARLTEAIQHGVFKHFFPPLAWFALLGIMMHLTKPDRGEKSTNNSQPAETTE